MKNKKQKLLYLAAASHSGSTLTAMLLGAHPDVCSVGELKAVHLGDADKYLCSCKDTVQKCYFWQGVTEKMAFEGHSFNITDAKMDIRSGADRYVLRLLKPLVRHNILEYMRDFLLNMSPSWCTALPLLQQRNSDYVRVIAAQSQATWVVDSSKIGIRLKYLLKNKDLDIKVLWLVRDGRGVSLAYKNPSQFADAKDPTLRGGGVGKTQELGRDIAQGAHEWVRCNEEIEAILSQMDKQNWLKVAYEDICLDTENTLHKVFQFMGVDSAQTRLDFKSVEHHVIGNGMRLDESETIELDQRWKHQLTVTDLGIFSNVAGAYQKKMGYGWGTLQR
ncbi:hypothetical protein PCNPT3_01380 [Psychromonas sp. CNPT3]|uniref:sulfotransferase n=1 Tax=Psychromonas sp. CNPT3 TaxID=314282 RepID=UPI00006E9554|nr:sulfotransferase [Psychromonas sp. CNPT3]AGH80218.1 hypothetical protein PCNPT3_01380 [Psychromonas sp. CNPT3]